MSEVDDPGSGDVGAEMLALVDRLYPICRSITGDGVRETLRHIGELIPLEVHEVASGTAALDWEVPDEWNVRDAWVKNAAGERVIDFRAHNLHVLNYSAPVPARKMTLAELKPHLHTLPDHPQWIPYRTSYYERTWGFCLRHADLEALPEGEYEVCIDSTLEPGHLTYAECVIPGESDEEVLVSAHVCHPSLCNDNLSGLAVATFLARSLLGTTPPLTYRFVFAPGTIGALTWLERNRERTSRIRGGLTLQCLGDRTPFTFKRTFSGDTVTDRAAALVLARLEGEARDEDGGSRCIDFFPYGYDERQYNSPGFRMPIGALMRGRHGQFPEYHTSADDRDFISGARLVEAMEVVGSITGAIAGNGLYRNTSPEGEPQLGRRGLYRALGGSSPADLQMAMLWVLSSTDGDHDLLSIAERSGLSFQVVRSAADLLLEHDLLAPVRAR